MGELSEECTRALFLDLDHTLVKPKSGGTFPKDADDWELCYENIIGKIHQYKAKGYKLIIVTNQGGIDANFITEEEVLKKIDNVIEALQRPGTKETYIDAYYCKEMKSYYRKPNPGMAYQAAIEFNLDLSQSIMVGDMGTDEVFARRAGIGTFKYADDFFGVA